MNLSRAILINFTFCKFFNFNIRTLLIHNFIILSTFYFIESNLAQFEFQKVYIWDIFAGGYNINMKKYSKDNCKKERYPRDVLPRCLCQDSTNAQIPFGAVPTGIFRVVSMSISGAVKGRENDRAVRERLGRKIVL